MKQGDTGCLISFRRHFDAARQPRKFRGFYRCWPPPFSSRGAGLCLTYRNSYTKVSLTLRDARGGQRGDHDGVGQRRAAWPSRHLSLVRSPAPAGTAREICAIFVSRATGLGGHGYIGSRRFSWDSDRPALRIRISASRRREDAQRPSIASRSRGSDFNGCSTTFLGKCSGGLCRRSKRPFRQPVSG
jgi:hypothetical protein